MGKIALALGILLLATGGAQAQLTVTDKTILRTGKLKLEIHYPQTGRAEIDKRFAKQAQDFATDGDLNDTSEGANSGSHECGRGGQTRGTRTHTYIRTTHFRP